MVKNLPKRWETQVSCLAWEDPLEKGMATHASILPGNFYEQCLENPMDRGAWQAAAVHGVAESQTQLKRHSMQHAPCSRHLVRPRGLQGDSFSLQGESGRCREECIAVSLETEWEHFVIVKHSGCCCHSDLDFKLWLCLRAPECLGLVAPLARLAAQHHHDIQYKMAQALLSRGQVALENSCRQILLFLKHW